MSVPPEAMRLDDDAVWVELSDGRTMGVPLARFSRLLHANPVDRGACTLMPRLTSRPRV